jgi:sugar lactone lactonase YvrE
MSRPRILLAVALAFLAGCDALAPVRGGRRLEDRSTPPALPGTALEKVVDLDYPPGNIAVSRSGRVFFTLHPDGHPPTQVMELVNGTPVPYAPAGTPAYQTVLALRIDAKNRLWALDHAEYARGTPRILAFDLTTDTLAQAYDVPASSGGFLSMLNDLQTDPEGRALYIAEASPIRQRPAIIVYDPLNRTSRRVLERHPSVVPKDFILQAPGRDMIVYGFYRLSIGIDSIAIDARGEWLYYGPVNGDRLYRLPTAALRDTALSEESLAARVEDYGPKPISDGLSSDLDGNIYLTDPEHSAILTLGPDRTLRTLVKDERLRWPDGLSFGPDGWLYVTCSSLHHVLFVDPAVTRANAPYQIFRFKPGPTGVPGH